MAKRGDEVVTSYLISIGLLLLTTLGIGLVRVWRGPTSGDRMLSVLLIGTTGVALLLVLSVINRSVATLDVALVLSVLAPIAVAAYVVARRPVAGQEPRDG